MRNAWYIAATRAELVPGKLLACTLFSEDILLFRDSQGVAHALLDQCPHRGARLSDGKLKGNCVACPFHGWEFAGDGQCQCIPANGRSAPIPSGAHLKSYPVCEKIGHVWVFVGQPERQTELLLPEEVTRSDYRGVPFRTEWQANYTRTIENILDVSHLPFVHPETTGENVNPQVDGPRFQVDEREIRIEAKPYHPLLDTPLNQAETEARGYSTITFTYPNQLMLRTDIHQSNQMCTYLAITPVTEARTRIYGLALRNFLLDFEAIDFIHYEHNIAVLAQDGPIVEKLRPKHAPLDLNKECHVRSDAPQIRYRLMLQKALQAESE